MKKSILLLATIITIIFSCNQVKENHETNKEALNKKALSIKGTWERTSFYNYKNGIVIDSFKSNKSNRHIKVFTNSKVMWCRNISSDSTEWFGYGNYKLSDSLLTETLEYGSVRMSKIIAQNPKFVFKYNLEENKFSQIQLDDEGSPVFSENYIRLE